MLAQAQSAKKRFMLSESSKQLGPSGRLLSRSQTQRVSELHATMVAAQEQLRPFCLSPRPATFPGCSVVYVLFVCFRPLLERFAPSSWTGFYIELARLGGPSGVLTLLTIARIDSDGTGNIDEDELKAFERVAEKLIRDTCDALQSSAVVVSLLFGATFQSVIGRPSFMEVAPLTLEAFGEGASEALLWVAYTTMCLISVLCLVVIMYAFGSRPSGRWKRPSACLRTAPHRPAWARLQAPAAPPHPGAHPEQLGSLLWPQQPASGRPKGFYPFCTARMELQNVLPSTQARLFYLCDSWLKVPSALSEDTAPSAFLGHLKAQAAPMHPGAKLGATPRLAVASGARLRPPQS